MVDILESGSLKEGGVLLNPRPPIADVYAASHKKGREKAIMITILFYLLILFWNHHMTDSPSPHPAALV